MTLLDALGIILCCAVLLAVVFVFSWASEKLGIHTQRPPHKPPAPDPQWLQYLSDNEYVSVGEALIECIAQQYSSLGLSRPGSLALHMAPNDDLTPPSVRYDPSAGILYTYYFDRGVGLSSGGLNSGGISLSTLPTDLIGKKLSSTFPNFCKQARLGAFHVVRVADVEDGRVRIEILRGF